MAANCKNIIGTTTDIKNRLYDSEESVYNILGNINRKLSDISRLDPETVSKFTASISTITSQIKDLTYELENYSSKIDLDDAEYAKLETRLNLISGLKRRYGPTIKDVLNNLHSAEDKFYLYKNSASIRQKLSEDLISAQSEFMAIARELSKKTKKDCRNFYRQNQKQA